MAIENLKKQSILALFRVFKITFWLYIVSKKKIVGTTYYVLLPILPLVIIRPVSPATSYFLPESRSRYCKQVGMYLDCYILSGGLA
jgi:hypothetical protein